MLEFFFHRLNILCESPRSAAALSHSAPCHGEHASVIQHPHVTSAGVRVVYFQLELAVQVDLADVLGWLHPGPFVVSVFIP
ncbi:hypothetical protein RvY_19148 [Ramazzottius varieornatus]|uniref:Uncharacterized protein n=1 Tax=Ramazzottius varieornatus TaxID=947166 RepID=A0A1D1WBM8_RAMVA|nr:hypothetical protein RvY_19148 [Ramazzottius varieornatus]